MIWDISGGQPGRQLSGLGGSSSDRSWGRDRKVVERPISTEMPY